MNNFLDYSSKYPTKGPTKIPVSSLLSLINAIVHIQMLLIQTNLLQLNDSRMNNQIHIIMYF